MIGLIAAGLAKAGVAEKLARPLAIAGLVVAALVALAILKGCYDRSVIENATNEANAEFAQDKDEATGEADMGSADRRADHAATIRRTEELIDEALEKGCVVADYLASHGADCVQPPAAGTRLPAE